MTIEEAEKIIVDLRKENAERRVANNSLKDELATAVAEHDKTKKAVETLTTTLKTTQEEVVKVKEDSVAAVAKLTADQKEAKKLDAVKIMALKEGLVDEDGLKLADLSKITMGEDGKLVGAEDVLKGLKEAKPYLFGKAQHSSNPDKKPKPGDPEVKDVKDQSPEEYERSKAELLKSIK